MPQLTYRERSSVITAFRVSSVSITRNIDVSLQMLFIMHMYIRLYYIHIYTFVKCTCLHAGHGNEDIHYTVGGIVLSTTIKQNDLIISDYMKVSDQCGIAASNEDQVCGTIRRNTEHKKKELIIPLYKTIDLTLAITVAHKSQSHHTIS